MLVHVGLVDPRVRRVGGDDPQALDLAAQDALDDLVVGQAALASGCVVDVDAEDVGDLVRDARRW